MQKQKNYVWLDRFRLIAALLVIAIHTSPLASFSGEADFFLTRVLARIAVPFFLMVTGFFFPSDPDKLRKSLKKLCLLYGTAILLYLPLGLYAGHYRALYLTDALRMLLFDGGFYHLWYFPAAITGIILVFTLKRVLRLRWVCVISVVLYVIGLFGDSYFGLAEKLPPVRAAYEGMFRLFSYTRNGIFMAPVFLVLGILIRKYSLQALRLSALRYTFCLLVSFACLTAEAFTLHNLQLQRHDSMYVFLLPVMASLFLLLLALPEGAAPRRTTVVPAARAAVPRRTTAVPTAGAATPRKAAIASAAMWIYLLHPAFIVLVRAAAKLLHLTGLLVDNSLLHYLAVSILSVAAGLALSFLQTRFFSKRWMAQRLAKTASPTSRAWIELDLDALRQNIVLLQKCVPDGCRLMPAVKANAYGHGAIPIARELNRLGIDCFCVACAAEGIELRRAGITGEILILGYTHPTEFSLLCRYRLTQSVTDYAYAEKMQQSGIRLHVHIAVDTGMHRLGIRCEDIEHIAAVYQMKNLRVDGIFTHLSACDSAAPDCHAFTESQILAFRQVVKALSQEGVSCKGIHLLSSYGMLNYPGAAESYVRPGIALYGLFSTEADTRNLHEICPLEPVLSLKARVASVRTLYAGESVGYGLAFTADHDMQIAVLSIGYADGLPRELSCGNGSVLIGGQRAPIVGRICMDQTLIDVSHLSDVKQGDTAVLIGVSGSEQITAGELAGKCHTIANELLSRLGSRLERIV